MDMAIPWTKDWNELPREPFRVERIDGVDYVQMGAPGLNHSTMIFNMADVFRQHFNEKKCQFYSNVAVHLFNDDNFVVPDMLILCDLSKIRNNKIFGPPDLIAEVLSPSNANHDKKIKMKTYAKAGVKEYWLVESRRRTVEVYVLQDEHYTLDHIYYVLEDWEFNDFRPDEQEKFRFKIHSPAFPDMSIETTEIFKNLT